MQILEIKLDGLNQNTARETPSFFVQVALADPLSSQLQAIHQYFSDYVPTFFTIDNLVIVGPYGEVDYNVPLFVYMESGHLKAPSMLAKYRVKDPQVVLKQKFQKRPKNKLILFIEGQGKEFQGVEQQTIESILKQIGKFQSTCYSHKVRIQCWVKIKNLDRFRSKDGNIYVLVQE